MRIDGSGVIVAGGASGLGLATAQTLRQAGARVGVIDMAGPGGWDGAFAQADITDEDQVKAAFAALAGATGQLRGMLNTAGTGHSGLSAGPGASVTAAGFRRVLDVNALGSFIMSRVAAEAMIPSEPDANGERGVLVNTSSIVAMEGQIGTAAYAAAKGAVNAMTLPLAREFARYGIRIMTIAPGIFETPMFTNAKGPMVEWLREQVQFPARPGEASEFAAMVRHIFENPMLNGDTIRLDGAYRVPPGQAGWWVKP
jgi:3-hydroxyacyl-CoA dehydrogenase / 3-hydroxy-2-methylbutyryl-CoA dehydrogenase